MDNYLFDVMYNIYKDDFKYKKCINRDLLFLLEIFIKLGYGIPIDQYKLEMLYHITYITSYINDLDIITSKNKNDLLDILYKRDDITIPDIKYIIDTFYEKYKNYGLIKDDSANCIQYIWQPILKETYELKKNELIFNYNDE